MRSPETSSLQEALGILCTRDRVRGQRAFESWECLRWINAERQGGSQRGPDGSGLPSSLLCLSLLICVQYKKEAPSNIQFLLVSKEVTSIQLYHLHSLSQSVRKATGARREIPRDPLYLLGFNHTKRRLQHTASMPASCRSHAEQGGLILVQDPSRESLHGVSEHDGLNSCVRLLSSRSACFCLCV